jgi:hypothetical protein
MLSHAAVRGRGRSGTSNNLVDGHVWPPKSTNASHVLTRDEHALEIFLNKNVIIHPKNIKMPFMSLEFIKDPM